MAAQRVTIRELNEMGCDAFVDAIGWVFEHSPWIARSAWEQRPFSDIADLHCRLCEVARAAPLEAQLGLVRAHPELGGRSRGDEALTDASRCEQRSVGLDAVSGADRDRLVTSAAAYVERFGFPCIVCVRNHPDAASITAAIERRLTGTAGAQLDASVREVFEIARLRLSDAIGGAAPMQHATARGSLTTHVLDIARGTAGAGMTIELWRAANREWSNLKTVVTNADGRTDDPLLAGTTLTAGCYPVRFDVGSYFASAGVPAADPPYLDSVPVEVGVSNPEAHYHVPLIVAPWGYSTYRGS